MSHTTTSVRQLYSSMREFSFHSPSPSFSGPSNSFGSIFGEEDDSQEIKEALGAYWVLARPFTCKRHRENVEVQKTMKPTWRMKERMKTVSVALVLCLNVGVDPPDVVKIYPCARQECWIDPMMFSDPLSTNNMKAVEAVGTALQHQYERWQPRARYKLSLDPTMEEVKKLCQSLRRNAKDERVLFHYNGHGVPRPTKNGEIWVFNKQFTQYIPLAIFDLHGWMGTPSIYVFDCSSAGHILDHIRANPSQLLAASLPATANPQANGSTTATELTNSTSSTNEKAGSDSPLNNLILLAACGANELLPMNPDLPADLFTACLTTPMQIALKWFILQKTSLLVPSESMDLLDKIPGMMNDRRTMIGELNWIFTAITDTIAWNLLSRELFQKLFRQDLLVASLFRNFLLAERIMRSYNCTPVSIPRLPATFQHPMWQAWDMTLDHCLSQLPQVKDDPNLFVHCPFFSEQLTAFQVWLSYGSERRSPPEQLPIVLQVLLSQVHRQKALELLGRFLDLGPWAANLALSVGIFPYVLKLLQSSARELRPLLVFIWAKLLAVDTSCQADLVKDSGHKYFLFVLSDAFMPAEYRTMAAFILTVIVDNYQNGQEVALQGNLIAICLEQLSDDHALLRQWCALCLGKVWTNYDAARWCGVRDSAHTKLAELLTDPVPEVRAAVVFALGTFINNTTAERTEQVNNIDQSVARSLLPVLQDASPLVRKELVVALSKFVGQFESHFVTAALQLAEEESTREYHTVAGPMGVAKMSNEAVMNTIHTSNAIRRSVSTRSLKGGHVPPGASATTDQVPELGSGGPLKHVGTYNPGLRGSTQASLYTSVWRVVQQLCLDEVQGVQELAKKLHLYVHNKPLHVKPSPIAHLQQQQRKLSMPVPPVVLSTSPGSVPGSPSNRPITFLTPRQQQQQQMAVQGTDTGAMSPELARAARGSRGLEHSDTLPRIGSGSGLSSRLGMRRNVTDKRSLTTSFAESTPAAQDKIPDTTKPLTLQTDFFTWCCRYFAEPMMHNVGTAVGTNKGLQGDDPDPEGPQHQEREYRFICAERAIRAAERLPKVTKFAKFEEVLFHSRLLNSPSSLCFHPYQNILAQAEKYDINIWDWETGQKLRSFSNRSPPLIKLTSTIFINAHDDALLLTGSEDGVVKVFKDFSTDSTSASKSPVLVTAWPALTDMIPMSKGSGLVLCYDPERTMLYSTGHAKHITQWDLSKELKVTDVSTGSEGSITSLAQVYEEPDILVTGCADSSVRIFDLRLSASNANVLTYTDHRSVVVNAHTLRSYTNKIISASELDDIHVWDRRMGRTINKIQTKQESPIKCLVVHQYVDIIACGFESQGIGIFGHQGESFNNIKFHEGFMGAKFGKVSSLAFHPLQLKLAAGNEDQSLTVYSSNLTEGRKR